MVLTSPAIFPEQHFQITVFRSVQFSRIHRSISAGGALELVHFQLRIYIFSSVKAKAVHWLQNQINVGLFLLTILDICNMVRGPVCGKEDSNLSEDAAKEHVQETGGSHYGD
jgi:hypothetical protein